MYVVESTPTVFHQCTTTHPTHDRKLETCHCKSRPPNRYVSQRKTPRNFMYKKYGVRKTAFGFPHLTTAVLFFVACRVRPHGFWDGQFFKVNSITRIQE